MNDSTANDDNAKPQDPNPPGGNDRGHDPVVGNLGTHSQQFSHTPVAARVPERVARGRTATGVLVLDSPTEFVIDFLQGLTRPHQVVSRIVMHPQIMQQLAAAPQDNINKYSASYGMPNTPPATPQRRPSIQEIYENFKLSDEQLSGAYANSIIIGHSQAEFYLDFITGFYPTAAVSARVFLSASQAPRIMETINIALQQHRKRFEAPPQSNPGG